MLQPSSTDRTLFHALAECAPRLEAVEISNRTGGNVIALLPAQVTPLHTDPYHNLLSQVVGRKHVRLYSPQTTSRLYPFESGFTTNCSQVSNFCPSRNLMQLSHQLQPG